MGVVNTTPDSFSDGGLYFDSEGAVAHGLQLWEEGADIVDVGGASTRPGAEDVSESEEVDRTTGVVESLVTQGVVVSIDTFRPNVAAAAIAAGAEAVNDVTALADPAMAQVVAESGAGVVLMHMQGEPRTMQDAPHYDDVVSEVAEFLVERAEFAESSGIDPARISVDPGIGFGKSFEHNLDLLSGLDRLVEIGKPVLLGTSRKRFLGQILGEDDPLQRDIATSATLSLAISQGVSVLRVHNVAMALQTARVADAIVRA